MQTDAQKLVVVRDQFALKGLSDDVLKQILPAYQEAIRRLEFLLANLPPAGASIARELWLRTQLATIRAQFEPVADRIYQILPEAQARAFEEGLSNAQKYLEAGGITPEPVKTTTLTGVTTGGQQVSVSGNLPGFNVTNALEKGFISPSITRQQVIAAARETGFSVLSPGGSKYGLAELLPNWMDAQSKQVERHLRSGFLVGMTNDEIMREIGPLGPGRRGWAMTEAVVRTSMAEASQSAHDAFYEANADLLPGTKSGYRWWWDASNDTRLCPLCAPLDGVKFKERDKPPAPWPRHFSCRCKLLPWTATQELLEKEDGPASGSFLEATPVQYDKRGKRLPPPPGYTGDDAYKRPMKVDGQMQWVRRRDLGPGQTTAGDMLQNANEHSKRLVLGKHTEAFNTLTGPGGRYEKNPQGAVRELLGKGLPPGSTAPRPTRGPGPKPAPPKPKGPKPVSEMTPEEIKREREATIARLQARKAARDAAAAPPPPPKPAVPDLADRVLPSGPKTALVFGKQGGTGKMFQDAWEQIEGIKGEVGENAKKVREFINKQQVMVNIGLTDDLAADLQRFAGNKLLLASQQKVVDVMESYQGAPVVHKLRGASVWAKRINDRLVDGDLSLLGDYLKPMKGSSGHTNAIHGIVNAYMRPSSIGINGKGAKELVANAERALKEMNAYIDFYKPGRITGPGPTIPPARPFSASGAEEDVSMRWFTTAIHELGHQVHYRGAGARPLGNAWSKLGGERFVSGYAHSNEREQFAEAFVQFVLNPKGLKASHPRLYAWVSNALEEALK